MAPLNNKGQAKIPFKNKLKLRKRDEIYFAWKTTDFFSMNRNK